MTQAQYEARKQALIEEIKRVFDGVERQDGVTIHEARVIDDYGSDKERAEARLLDTESRWQDVPDEDLRFYCDALSFFDAQGFHYYFPAYLVWYLHFVDCDDTEFWSNSFDSVDHKLLAYRGDKVTAFFQENFSLFATPQRKVVAEFLVFLRDRALAPDSYEGEEGPLGAPLVDEGERYQHALDIYWGQFL